MRDSVVVAADQVASVIVFPDETRCDSDDGRGQRAEKQNSNLSNREILHILEITFVIPARKNAS